MTRSLHLFKSEALRQSQCNSVSNWICSMKNGTKNYRTVKSKQITFSFKLQCNLNTLKNFLKKYIPLRFASRQNLGQSCDLKLRYKYYNMVLQKSGKTADISRRHTTSHPAKWLLRNERKLHTDDASVARSGFVRRKSQPVKDTSSVLNFCARSDFIGYVEISAGEAKCRLFSEARYSTSSSGNLLLVCSV